MKKFTDSINEDKESGTESFFIKMEISKKFINQLIIESQKYGVDFNPSTPNGKAFISAVVDQIINDELGINTHYGDEAFLDG